MGSLTIFDLEVGQLRLREKGNAGGHHGVESVIASVGTTQFARVRLGIGRESVTGDVSDYVLAKIPKDQAESLAETVISAADAVEATKKQILDMLGVMVAGSTCSISGEINGLVDLVKEWGGKEESTILAFGGRVPAPNAAFVNGILCVRRDFDDTNLTYSGGHTSRSIAPTALAMAERLGNINGKEFITAEALGHDLECRTYFAAPSRGSW